ncbi:hypothetical protein [Asanoa iriomotensis]|uniref:SMODS and SLOG-associating 2TM effector domain-containing protein n=1 Tax=Asanoa iriomotensis TaxID=234613 RepID=A0ABQ4BYN0_9ACTN|nr:hypothetical protein [Asanoa iriomotensis]GIF55590.1 hypothetical protein Air01nite_16850 [Asanoa iriomotensis]
MTTDPYEIASRLRNAAVRARTLSGDFQHTWWFGGPNRSTAVANLERAAAHLDQAAAALAGSAPPAKRVMIASAVSTGTWAAVTAAVLLVIPDPGLPEVIVGAVLAGFLAADILGRVRSKVRLRRLTAEPAVPPTVPAAERLRQIRAAVDELLPAAEHNEAAVEHVRGAQVWLA